MAVKLKAFTDYIDTEPPWWGSKLLDYQQRPASTFLRESVHIADAINQCRRRFQKKKNQEFNKDAQDSIYRLGAAAFSSMMSHFETFERSLFAGVVEATQFLAGFSLEDCCKRLQKDSQLALDVNRLFAYRGISAPIGQLLADSLASWHSPIRVNGHFRALVPDFQLFGGAETEQLVILWQLRHSIVHTGNWLTHADAQKVPSLSALADRPILLNDNFIEATARRLHGIVGRTTDLLGKKVLGKIKAGTLTTEVAKIKLLFEVVSPRTNWLKTKI